MNRHLLLLLALGAPVLPARAFAGFDPGDWPMYNHDVVGTRHNGVEAQLRPDTVGRLTTKWTFNTPGFVFGTPAVRDDVVYAGDASGAFYAVSRDGALLWKTTVTGPVTASALVLGDVVIFGDQAGYVYGLDRRDGHVVWTQRYDAHPELAIYGSPTPVGDLVAIGLASNEEAAAGDPNYPCCSFRGSVVLLRPEDGSVVWKTYLIGDSDRAAGSSGAGVWSTPTFDEESGLLYVTTGNNYSAPTTTTSDAIVALDACSGRIVWTNQRYPNDLWNFRFPPSAANPDYDFGDSAQIYRLPSGRKVVGAGQKSGFYHVLDARTGQAIRQTQYEPGGPLGGLFADSAVADGIVFASGSDWPSPYTAPPTAGGLFAISADGTTQLWSFLTPSSVDLSGVAVAANVVYLQSTFDGTLFAVDERTGAQLAAVTIGPSMSGPSVSHGRVYVGTGAGAALSISGGPGSITSLGL